MTVEHVRTQSVAGVDKEDLLLEGVVVPYRGGRENGVVADLEAGRLRERSVPGPGASSCVVALKGKLDNVAVHHLEYPDPTGPRVAGEIVTLRWS